MKMKILLTVGVALLAGASSALGSIVVAGSDSHRDGDSDTAVNSLTNFTVAAGSDRKLVVSINTETAGSISGITYGGAAFSLASATGLSNGRMSQIWYLDAPAVGVADIVATFTGNARSMMGVLSLTGAATGVSVNDSVANGASSLNLTTTEADTFVVGSYIQNSVGNTLVNPFANELYLSDSGSSWGHAGYQNEATAGLHTYSYTNSDGNAGIAAAGFAAIPEPATLGLIAMMGTGIIFCRRLMM